MINSLCGCVGSLKTENPPCSKLQLSSPTNSTLQSLRVLQSLDTAEQCNASIIPPSLKFSSPKFDVLDEPGGDSPTTALLKSLVSFDQLDGVADFMLCSPARNPPPSPRCSSAYSYYNYNYNHAQAMQGQSISGCSPPRHSSQLGHSLSSSTHKERGPSPLQRVLNSPHNDQVMLSDTISLDFLEECSDNNKDECEGYSLSEVKLSGYGGTECFDMPTTTTASLQMPDASRFCTGSTKETGVHEGYQLNEELNDDFKVSSFLTATMFSEKLQQDHCQQKLLRQQLQKQLSNGNLEVPIPMGFEQEQDSGLQLVHLLLACAEAVSKEDHMMARRYLHYLNCIITPIGDSMQRVASCFTEALSERLASSLTTTTAAAKLSLRPRSFSPVFLEDSHKIYQILYQVWPYIKFAHFTANQAIFEAFTDEERVHVIDLNILWGYQWPAFMQALAARPGGAPFLRITGVGPCIESVTEAGRCLAELADSLHIPFEFHPVAEELERVKPHMLNRRVGEALAVNSVNRLHRVAGNCLGNLLIMIRDQAPSIVTLVEQEASHNGPYFLGRFLEALHYYSAIFDSLDATFPPNSVERGKVEQHIFAPEIRNIVACEGPDRIQRHERLEKWRKVMEGKGFNAVPLSQNAVTQSKILLDLYSCDGYRLKEDTGCLLLGWQDRPILAASAWRC